MTEIETKLMTHVEKAKACRERQQQLNMEMQVAETDFNNFLKEQGFPDQVGLPELLFYAMRKSHD